MELFIVLGFLREFKLCQKCNGDIVYNMAWLGEEAGGGWNIPRVSKKIFKNLES